MGGIVEPALASSEEQRELLEDICDVRAKWERETVAERQPSRDTDRRLSELVDRWQRRFPDSRLFDCQAGGYCYSLCPVIQHPGRAGFPPVVDAERAHCTRALAPNDPCARFRKQACADGSYLCAQAGVLADHARCHSEDNLLAVLARELCGGYLGSWEGEKLPAKPYVSTAGDPKWCKLFASPPPECGPSPTLTPKSSRYANVPCDDRDRQPVLGEAIRGIMNRSDTEGAQQWIDRCASWINSIDDDPSWWDRLRLHDVVTADQFRAYRRALAEFRPTQR